MLGKKIDRARRSGSVVRVFRQEVEAGMCDGDDIWEEQYARHHLCWIACSEVAAVAGVRAETVSRQFVTGFGEDEDTMMDMMLEFLETEQDKRQNTRFVKTFYENLGKNDTLAEFQQRLEAI